MKYATYLINLDKSTQRLDACTKEFAKQNITFERISAVYGADLSSEELALAYNPCAPDAHYKVLGVGEVGCFLSHRKVWQAIIDAELDFAVVLEDDIHLTGVSFAKMIEAIKQIDRPWYYIKILGVREPSHLLRSQEIDQFMLSTFQKVPARTGAQIVSREGAARLLKTTAPFYRPVDLDLQYWWEKNIFVDVLHPYVFAVNQNETSDIDAQKSRKKSAKKPIKRIFDRIKYYALVRKNGRALKAKLFL